MSDKSTLPGKTEENVIDVSLRQVITAFGGLVFATLTVGVSIVLLRDYAKYKRQKAVINAVTDLLLTLNPRSPNWKPEKKTTESVSDLPIRK